MDTSEIVVQLKPIISKYLPDDLSVDDITAEKNLLTDLRINSAYLIDIIIAIEDTFDIKIEDSELPNMNTVQESIDIISAKISERD
ncbi:MAG: phosphopantetheine-binding protein [Cyclobacteriaceae bacterium]